MERLVVESDGRVVIPPEIIHRRGLRPGNELILVEAAEGLLVYQGGVDAETATWLDGLSEDERRLAQAEARRYEALSEEEQDALWNEGAESLDAEGDEVELPAH